MSTTPCKCRKMVVAAAVIMLGLHLAVGSEAADFSLTDNLALWVRADAGVTSSGGVVTSWADQATAIGGSNDAVQVDPTKQPTLVANASPAGDRPVIRFDGADDLLEIAANTVFETNTLTWFCVYKAPEDTGETQQVLTCADGLSTSHWGTKTDAVMGDGTRKQAVWTRRDDGYYRGVRSDPLPMSEFQLVTAVWNGTSDYVNVVGPERIYGLVNGAMIPSANGNPCYQANSTCYGNLGLMLGGRVDGTHSLMGDICEIMVYDTCLSNDNRALVDQYLYQKWFAPAPWPGDTNDDGHVNADDAAALAAHWLEEGNVTLADGDFNGDFKVDDIDATILATNWLAGPNDSAAVPEPGLLGGLLALFSAGIILVRRRSAVERA